MARQPDPTRDLPELAAQLAAEAAQHQRRADSTRVRAEQLRTAAQEADAQAQVHQDLADRAAALRQSVLQAATDHTPED